MKLGIVINDFATESGAYTSMRLARKATELGHEVWVMGAADFAYDPNGSIRSRARSAPKRDYADATEYLKVLTSEHAHTERIVLDQLDVLLLRYDPADDAKTRPWAQTSPILFAQLCKRKGVIVLNDPHTLASAINKTYFQQFPERVRPLTLITRNPQEIKRFVRTLRGQAVLKPLQGSGGTNVFLVQGDNANVNQMIEAISRDGYVVCQEYLAAAQHGDVRLFVMNGRPLTARGDFAAFRRISAGGDMRNNMKLGGRIEKVEVDKQMLDLVELIRPKLVQDGMFLVGLDIVGDKLMEVNVFSPGGFGSIEELTGTDFSRAVIRAIERKVEYRVHYPGDIGNVELSTL